jgi:hypothetical protein
MATTTPNYGWDVPTSTDYVKDGATAIETLGDDIDASLYSITGGKNVGLVHLNTTTFSAQSTINIDNVFTSDYDDYRVIVDFTTISASNGFSLRYRTSGSTNSTSNYNLNFVNIEAWTTVGTLTGNQDGTGTSHSVGYNFTGEPSSVSLDIFNPNLSLKTLASGISIGNNLSIRAYRFNATTQFDGFSIFSASNLSGNIRVYGYRKS